MLIYKINFSLLTLFSLHIYIVCGRGLKMRAGCRQTEVQTNKLKSAWGGERQFGCLLDSGAYA